MSGLIGRVAGEAATPDWMKPSDQVTVHGAVPVSAALGVLRPLTYYFVADVLSFGMLEEGGVP